VKLLARVTRYNSATRRRATRRAARQNRCNSSEIAYWVRSRADDCGWCCCDAGRWWGGNQL